MKGIVSRYLAREFLFAFIVAFCFFFALFLANVLLVTAEDIFSKQVPVYQVARLVLFSFPLIVFYSVPFATLLGAVMAISRLSADNEVMAVRATGISLWKIFSPLAVGGIILSVVSFTANDLLLPISTLEFNKVYRRIIYSNPAVELEPFTVKRFPGTALVTGSVEGNTVHAPLIMDRTKGGQSRIITAMSATLNEIDINEGVISLYLRDVFAHIAADGSPDTYEYLQADSMYYNIMLRDISDTLVAVGPREMSSIDVWHKIQEMRASLAADKQRRIKRQYLDRFKLLLEIAEAEQIVGANSHRLADVRKRIGEISAQVEQSSRRIGSLRDLYAYELEFHKKFAIPLSCLAFVALAFPS